MEAVGPNRARPGRMAGIWVVLPSLLLSGGCTLVGTAPPPPPPPETVDAVALEGEVPDAAAEAQVARLLAEGSERLAAGDPGTARARAVEVESRFPTTRGSSRALLLRADAALALDEPGEALEAAERYLALAPTGDSQIPLARLVAAEARFDGGLGGGVEALFRVSEAADGAVQERALRRARAVAGDLEDPSLRDLVAEAPTHGWLLPVFQVELASRRALVGDQAVGRELAERALALAPAETEAERARAVLGGEVVATGAVSGTLGTLLSPSGPPTLRQLSEQLRDGVEVALLAPEFRGGVRLLGEDDGGSPGQASGALGRLEGNSPLGIVGPLTEPAMESALRGRSRDLPVISPTAPLLRTDFRGAYSLAGPDPEAPRALARLALDQGVREAVLLHPRDPTEEQEAQWFRQAFQDGGGRVTGTVTYVPGTTSLAQPMREVLALRPRALVLLLPPEDVEIVAPQVAFFGVDDLEGLLLLGSPAFSSEGVLSSVPTRHTEGVLSVAPHVGEGYGPLWESFVGAYEEHFRRTLRSPIPALGYDAARLLLEGARLGGGSAPEDVLTGLTRIQDFQGATGTFSVRDGRLVRRYVPVRIENRTRVPLDR